MVEIIKTEVQQMPKVKLIGRCYTEKDKNEYGTFAHCWGEWFQKALFDKLAGEGKGLQYISDDYIGLCICNGKGFDYWIGIFMSPDDEVPDGFDSIEFEASKIFVCYVKGREDNCEIYGETPTLMCYDEMKKQGYARFDRDTMYERYNCPRYTVPDKDGNVILDYCIFIKD